MDKSGTAAAAAAGVVTYLVGGQEFQLTREEAFRFPGSFFARQQEFAAEQKAQQQRPPPQIPPPSSSGLTSGSNSSGGPVDDRLGHSTPSPPGAAPTRQMTLTPGGERAKEEGEEEEREKQETGAAKKKPPPSLVSPSREPAAAAAAVVELPGRSPEFFGLIKEFYAASGRPAAGQDNADHTASPPGGGSTSYRLVLGGARGGTLLRRDEVRVSFVGSSGAPVQAERRVGTPPAAPNTSIPEAAGGGGGSWRCLACSFHNPPTPFPRSACRMCGNTITDEVAVRDEDAFIADFPADTVCSEVHISVRPPRNLGWGAPAAGMQLLPFRVEHWRLSDRGAAAVAGLLRDSEVMMLLPAPAQTALRSFLPNDSWLCIHERADFPLANSSMLRCFLPDAVPTLPRRFALPSAWVETPEMQGLFWEEVQFYQLEELEASMAIELLQSSKQRLRPFIVGPPGRLRLRSWPGKDKKQLWATLWLALHFLPDRLYREHEVDWVISDLHAAGTNPDCASIKKEFARRGIMRREPGGMGHTLCRAGVQAALDGEYRPKGLM